MSSDPQAAKPPTTGGGSEQQHIHQVEKPQAQQPQAHQNDAPPPPTQAPPTSSVQQPTASGGSGANGGTAGALVAAGNPAPNPAPDGLLPSGRYRPTIALSSGLMKLYRAINEDYFVWRRMQGEGAKFNNGYDDKEGHYVVLSGEEVFHRYTVTDVLGKGSFGTVLKCFDERRQETVALKVTRNGQNFRSQAKLEIDILLKLSNIPELHDLIVRILKVFDWKGHLVLVFELLSFNLYQLIKCTKFNGVSLDLVRKFGYQLVQVLHQMQLCNPAILHCDLKPENILLKNQNRSGIRVIDFGSACYANRKLFKYIQSRYYRSPEVILNLEYSTAIDRWSLGCCLVELHVGTALFDGRTELQQLHKMQAVLGPLPAFMIENSPKREKFYTENNQLRECPQPLNLQNRSLEQILGVSTGGPGGRRANHAGHDEATYRLFLDIVTKLLSYDPARRITTTEALDHPFLAPLRDAARPAAQ